MLKCFIMENDFWHILCWIQIPSKLRTRNNFFWLLSFSDIYCAIMISGLVTSNPDFAACEQGRTPGYASARSNQRFCYSLSWKNIYSIYMQTFNDLASPCSIAVRIGLGPCADPELGTGGPDLPLENHKNIGLDPQKLARPRWISLLRVDKSLCLPKLKPITVLLYGFSFKNENFASFSFVVKDNLRHLRTFSQVLATVIKVL